MILLLQSVCFVLNFCCLFSFSIGSIDENLRGVPPQLVSLYSGQSQFECLDGLKKISFDYVNDDYCDCADGSDEPGTSACSNGNFYCRNNGFRPLTIPSSRVNDYICDCCDGSDEWLSGVECPNVCQIQGEKWREEAKQIRQIQEFGWAKRVELVQSGEKLIDEKKADLEKFRHELSELEPLKTSVETIKNAAEEREREAKEKHDNVWNALKEEYRIKKDNELFTQLDANSDSKIDVSEIETYVKSKGEPTEDDIKEVQGENVEFDVVSFREVSQKINALVKRLINDAQAKKIDDEVLTTLNPDEASTPPTSVEELNENEADDDAEDDQLDSEQHHNDEQNDDEPPRPPYDEVTQTLISEADKARQEYENVLRRFSTLENEIRNAESMLEFDYGPDHVWAPLKGECTELTTTQYTYRLCLFDRSIQKDRNGNSEVNLGYWNSWAGPENDKYLVQKYDKGQSCWNGPERSTHVDLECGVELQLVEASEPSKCEYRFLVKSPVVCRNPVETAEHEEL